MTTPREGLDRPFTPDEIQWRPGAAKYDHKPTCEGQRCREAKDPDKHMQLAYVDDEQVMDRLDEGFGSGNWQLIVEPVPVYENVAKVRLGVTYNGETWLWFEDFGYANRADGDPMKEAVTDGIRRVGRFVSKAVRELYRKDAVRAPITSANGRTSSRPAAASYPQPVPPSAPAGGQPEEPEWVAEQMAGEAAAPVRGGQCPMHHLAWVKKPGGVSKTTGKPYGAFWACPSTERPFCKEKPSEAWIEAAA